MWLQGRQGGPRSGGLGEVKIGILFSLRWEAAGGISAGQGYGLPAPRRLTESWGEKRFIHAGDTFVHPPPVHTWFPR